jgi:hypothetical protein
MRTIVISVLVALGVASSTLAQNLPTTGEIETRLGTLERVNGFPTEETVTKIYDGLDFQRACQAYLWALPYMAMTEWQRWAREEFGAGNLGYVEYLDFNDTLGILTANATTPYAQAFPNLAEAGPLVFEFPPGALAGGTLDFWQRPITDTGQTGPDRGQGGKFLILGPEHPNMDPTGYFVFRSPTNNVWSGQCGLDADVEKAKALLGQMKIYPYAQRDHPPPTAHVRPNKPWLAAQPRGLQYWEGLAKTINAEPAHE